MMFRVWRAIEKSRASIHLGTSPEEHDSLETALSLIAKESGPTSAKWLIVTEGRPRTLQRTIRDDVYTIARESMVNAVRHAQAARIEIKLHFASDGFRMLIHDDGCGIDCSTLLGLGDRTFGLSRMKAGALRMGADFEVLSRVACGTEVRLTIPAGVAFEREATASPIDWPLMRYAMPIDETMNGGL